MARKQLVPLDMNNSKIINLATPTVGTDAATKAYVDSSGGSGSQGLIIPPQYKTSNFTASFADSFYIFSSSSGTDIQAILPTVTAGDIGKVIFFKSEATDLDLLYIDDVDGASTNRYFGLRPFESVAMVAKSTNFATGRWQPILASINWQYEISDIHNIIAANYVPYNGANQAIDFAGNTLTSVADITNTDMDISLISTNSNTIMDTDGTHVGMYAANSYGSGDGGSVFVMSGSADYDIPGSVGNGGSIFMQLGAPGIAGGNRGFIYIGSPITSGYPGALGIHIDDLTTARTLQMPDADGTLIAGTGVSSVTVGTTAPATPAIGDLWVDTN